MTFFMRVPRRVAILKPSALGDIVHALPVLSALRAEWPSAHITWVVNRVFQPLLVGHPHLNDTMIFDRAAYKKNLLLAASYSGEFINELRRRRFDLVLDLQGLLRTGLMCAATGAPVRIGFANAREGSRHFYTHRVDVPDAGRIHAVERYWRIVERLGAGKQKMEFHVPLQQCELEASQQELADLPRPWIAIAAGARWLTKRWPIAHFAELANRMFHAYGGSAILVGAPDDNALSLDLSQQLRGPFRDLTGQTSLPRLAAILSKSDVMLANDTGPLHLAAALGRPCVAPYTCTKVTLHGPFGSMAGGIETSVACRGSYFRECPNGLICFADLSPDKLWKPLQNAIETGAKQRCD